MRVGMRVRGGVGDRRGLCCGLWGDRLVLLKNGPDYGWIVLTAFDDELPDNVPDLGWKEVEEVACSSRGGCRLLGPGGLKDASL